MLFHSFIYVAISLFILRRISINVIGYRRKYKASLGDKGHEDLQRRIRAQANFTEFIPLFLISLIVLSPPHITLPSQIEEIIFVDSVLLIYFIL